MSLAAVVFSDFEDEPPSHAVSAAAAMRNDVSAFNVRPG
jgi:hypothetical protein